jgi:hypothetical protein
VDSHIGDLIELPGKLVKPRLPTTPRRDLMAYYYDCEKGYTCGLGAAEGKNEVSVTIGYELDEANDTESFSFEFKDGALTVKCSKELAAEIASAFAAVAEA